jgi:hypothetical protein
MRLKDKGGYFSWRYFKWYLTDWWDGDQVDCVDYGIVCYPVTARFNGFWYMWKADKDHIHNSCRLAADLFFYN